MLIERLRRQQPVVWLVRVNRLIDALITDYHTTDNASTKDSLRLLTTS
jgi:hypothetical protein